MMRVLVVGATGFIGGHLARGFLQGGARVTALVRSAVKADRDRGLGHAEIVEGTVEDPPEAALSGPYDVVAFAAGAWTRGERVDPAEAERRCDAIYRVGVARLAERARAWGAHFVFLSGASRFGRWDWPSPVSEDTPAEGLSLYGRSKRQAEGILATEGNRGLRWTALCPHEVYGARDRGSYLAFMFERIWARRFVHIGAGNNRWSICNVENIVRAVRRLAEAEGQGPLLIADERPSTHREMARVIAEEAGRSARFVHVPRALAMAAATMRSRLPTLARSARVFSPRDVELRTSTMVFDTTRAERAGIVPTADLRSGVRAAVPCWIGNAS